MTSGDEEHEVKGEGEREKKRKRDRRRGARRRRIMKTTNIFFHSSHYEDKLIASRVVYNAR